MRSLDIGSSDKGITHQTDQSETHEEVTTGSNNQPAVAPGSANTLTPESLEPGCKESGDPPKSVREPERSLLQVQSKGRASLGLGVQ